MRVITILSLAVLCYGRPEAGYNYVAQNSVVGGFDMNTVGNRFIGSSVGFGGASQQQQQFLNGGIGSSDGVGLFGASSGSSSLDIGLGGGNGGGIRGLQSTGFSNGLSNFDGQQALVQKHIYVHVPPPEPEEHRIQQALGNGGIAQKHYKIIFIKAPSPPAPTPAQLALAAQNAEKTIIYVLVKQPNDLTDVSVPTALTQPSKPEVYFIKYKTQREQVNGLSSVNSGSAINGGPIVSNGDISGIDSAGAAIGTSSSSQFIGINQPTAAYGLPVQSGPY